MPDEGNKLDNQLILEWLRRVEKSPTFAHKYRLMELLVWLTTKVQKGEAASLKKSVIAVEFFKKNGTNQDDSIVPQYMGRLRDGLTEYYATDGRADMVRMDVQEGHYHVTLKKLAITDHALQFAKVKEIDLKAVLGTGPDGRIEYEDVLEAAIRKTGGSEEAVQAAMRSFRGSMNLLEDVFSAIERNAEAEAPIKTELRKAGWSTEIEYTHDPPAMIVRNARGEKFRVEDGGQSLVPIE